MISLGEQLSICERIRFLQISWSSFYSRSRPVSEANLALMPVIDELYLECPFAGRQLLRDLLLQRGVQAGRRRKSALMRRMTVEARYRRPNMSKLAPGQRIYPYLLRSFVYLAAVIDWHSRRVLSWKLSNTMDVSFCLEALDEALEKYSKPEIFNIDQGSQFPNAAFTDQLKQAGIKISMDGKGRWADNVFVERFWRSLKCEEI